MKNYAIAASGRYFSGYRFGEPVFTDNAKRALRCFRKRRFEADVKTLARVHGIKSEIVEVQAGSATAQGFVILATMACGTPAAAETTWNPSACQLFLSVDKLSATGLNGVGNRYGCRSTTSKSTGLVYWQFRVGSVAAANTWQAGLVDAGWVMNSGTASPNAAFVYLASGNQLTVRTGLTDLCTNGGVVAIGSTIEMAADLVNRKIDARREGDANWCVSGGPQPNQGTGTIAGTAPWYIGFFNSMNDTAGLRFGNGPLPAGYSYWDVQPLVPPDTVGVANAQRFAGNPIIPFTALPWSQNGQTCCSIILDDANDPNKILMYLVAWTPNPFTGGRPVRVEGHRSNPYNSWNLTQTQQGDLGPAIQLFEADPSTGWEADMAWMESVFYVPATHLYHMYYQSNWGLTRIGVATSPDGKVWTKYAQNPVLVATGDERDVGNPFVWYENGTFTMIYSWRNSELGLTLPGYRYATSADGFHFTKPGGGSGIASLPGPDIYSCTKPFHCEVHKVYKFKNTYLLYSEQGTGLDTATPVSPCTLGERNPFYYRHRMAEADNILGPYRDYSGNPIFSPTRTGLGLPEGSIPVPEAQYWDRFHVATPFLYKNPANPNPAAYLDYYQGAGQYDCEYGANNWSVGVADIELVDLTGGGGGSVALLPGGTGRSSMGLRR